MPFVMASVRWATGKRVTDRLPKLSLITLLELTGYTGQHVTKTLFQFLGIHKYFSDSWQWGNSLFFNKRFHGGREIRLHDQRPIHGLSTMPFVMASVRWDTGKRVTDRLPKLSLIPKGCTRGNSWYNTALLSSRQASTAVNDIKYLELTANDVFFNLS